MTPERPGPQSGDGAPSMLDLVRLSPRPLFPPGGRELYRQIALLSGMEEGGEVLVAACGVGVTLEYFVREFGVQGSGVDEDPLLIQRAEARARAVGLQDRLQFQHGSIGSLPYLDGVFDVTVAEVGLTARAEPRRAVEELVRVTRPGGCVALVQLVWKAPVEPSRQEVLAHHLGARPLMLVELKRLLRESGVERLHTEDWTDEGTAFRPQVKKPFPDFAELFSVPEKVRILRRAWGRWGWRGVRTALVRETEVHRLLTRERILGLDLVKGRKVGEAEEGERERTPGEKETPPRGADAPPGEADARSGEGRDEPRGEGRGSKEADREAESLRGLPLFQGDGGS
jgi:SAM-dependent methyltransferase